MANSNRKTEPHTTRKVWIVRMHMGTDDLQTPDGDCAYEDATPCTWERVPQGAKRALIGEVPEGFTDYLMTTAKPHDGVRIEELLDSDPAVDAWWRLGVLP